MTLNSMMKVIDEQRLMRKHGFPFIMDIINTHKTWEDSLPVIVVEIEKFIIVNDVLLSGIFGKNYSTTDLASGFLKVIKRDFFKKGLTRENIALEALKTANSNGSHTITREVSWEWESRGIDIIAKSKVEGGPSMYFSVKGPNYTNTKGYAAHLAKLKTLKNNWPLVLINDKVGILMVDENTKEIKGLEVYGG